MGIFRNMHCSRRTQVLNVNQKKWSPVGAHQSDFAFGARIRDGVHPDSPSVTVRDLNCLYLTIYEPCGMLMVMRQWHFGVQGAPLGYIPFHRLDLKSPLGTHVTGRG